MPFISRHNIDKDITAPHDKAYKAQLKQLLVNPVLTEEQRQDIKLRINDVGKVKTYVDSPVKAGAITLD